MSLLITTVCDVNYMRYVPIFIKSIKKAYPNYDVLVNYRSCYKDFFDKHGCLKYIRPLFYLDYPQNKATSSSLRFCHYDGFMEKYDNIYITDVDMIILPEPIGIEEQHLKIMNNSGYCYENFAVCSSRYSYRMPGVLFANREYFAITRKERERLRLELKDPGSAMAYDFDEAQLYKICKNSGLPICYKGHENWRWHGIHIGKYTNRHGIRKAKKKEVDGIELNKIRQFLDDKELVSLYESCADNQMLNALSVMRESISKK